MIETVFPLMDPSRSVVKQFVEECNNKMKVVIDKLHPFLKKSYFVEPRGPWFYASHFEKRRLVHNLSTRMVVHRDAFKKVRNSYRDDQNGAFAVYH